MDLQQQREVSFRGNASPAVATAIPTPQYPQSSASSYRRPDQNQLRGYTGVMRDDRFSPVNVPGNRQPDKAWENPPPPVEDIASRGQSQDPRYDDMGYYDMAYNYSLPYGHYDHAEVAQEPVEAQDINTFDDADQNATVGPTQALDEWPHQEPIPNGPITEYLQRIAIHYLHQPNLQVSMIHMEPGHASGVQVVITLKLMSDL